MNTFAELALSIEISDILSLILIIVTFSTVKYASKTLLMEYSSQILVSRYRMNVMKGEKSFSWEVDIENKGRGYVVKAFILLSMKPRNIFSSKTYYLSKPILDIVPSEKDMVTLTLKEQDVKGTNPLDCDVTLNVYYQDALNNLYVVSPDTNETNKHLERFEKLPKKILFLSPRYFKYKYTFRRASQQENTFVNRSNDTN